MKQHSKLQNAVFRCPYLWKSSLLVYWDLSVLICQKWATKMQKKVWNKLQCKSLNLSRSWNVTLFVAHFTVVTLSRKAQRHCVPNIKHIWWGHISQEPQLLYWGAVGLWPSPSRAAMKRGQHRDADYYKHSPSGAHSSENIPFVEFHANPRPHSPFTGLCCTLSRITAYGNAN